MKSRTFTFKIFLCFCLVILFSVLVPSAYVLHNLRQESIELTTEAAQREAAFFQRYLLNELEKKKVPSEEALSFILSRFFSYCVGKARHSISPYLSSSEKNAIFSFFLVVFTVTDVTIPATRTGSLSFACSRSSNSDIFLGFSKSTCKE